MAKIRLDRMRRVPTRDTILKYRYSAVQRGQTFLRQLRVRFADGEKRTDCCGVESLFCCQGRHSGRPKVRLTLNDMVHHDQKMLALTSAPIVYAPNNMVAALKQISVDSG